MKEPPNEKELVGKTYRHFKGGIYQVLGFAKHSETEEWMVIYRAASTDGTWVRPYKMFFENVEHEGKTVPRFEKLD